jgi:hypothetical protein
VNYLHKKLSLVEVYKLLKSLNVTHNDDILVHGTTLDESNYDEVTSSIFENGVSKQTKSVAPFMSILATTSLLNKNDDLTGQIVNYYIGNTTFVLRIPKEYQGLYFGKINQKYAGRVSGMQDECVSILDVLELESIPSEFVVCALKKSNEEYGKYDVLVNPKYFELDKENNLKENIIELIETIGNEVKKDIIKDYMNIKELPKNLFDNYMTLFTSLILNDSDFNEEIYAKKNAKTSNIRK